MLKIDAQASRRRHDAALLCAGGKIGRTGRIPYAAVIVRDGEIVAETTNKVAQDRDVTRHAEMVAICLAQEALGSTDLSDCTIYANMEPCAFCSYAIRESRIAKVVFSMRSPVMGGASRWNILGDRVLSDTMPEVFAPPPVLLAEFLCEEGDAALRRSAPMAWAFMRARGLMADAVAAAMPAAITRAAAGPARGHVAHRRNGSCARCAGIFSIASDAAAERPKTRARRQERYAIPITTAISATTSTARLAATMVTMCSLQSG